MLPTKIRPIGNSFGIIIRDSILKMLDISVGDNLKIDIKGKKIILTKVAIKDDEDKKIEFHAAARKGPKIKKRFEKSVEGGYIRPRFHRRPSTKRF
jgi:antitoxin component of MazEF toxin-antitoxin module